MLTRLSRVPNEWLSLGFIAIAVILGTTIGLMATQVENPFLLVIANVALIGGLLLVLHVEWGAVLLVFMTHTYFSDVLIKVHGAPSVTKFIIPMIGLLVLFRWVFFREEPRGWQRPTILLVCYGMVGFFSLLYAVDFASTATRVDDYTRDMIIAITLVMLIQKGSTLEKVSWVFIGSGLFLGTIAVHQYLTGNFFNNYWGFGRSAVLHIVGESNDVRISGPIADPNAFAQNMLLVIPVAFDRFLHSKSSIGRALAGWSAAVSVLTVILTFSRGSFLGLLVMGVLILLVYKAKPSTFIGLALLLLVMLQLAPPAYKERMSTLTDFIPGMGGNNPLEESSFRGRTSETRVAMEMFQDHPFIGIGWNNYASEYQRYARPLGLEDRAQDRNAHSLYLEVASEQGMLGLFFFGALLYYMAWCVFYSRYLFLQMGLVDYAWISAMLGVGTVGYLVAAIFLHDAYPRLFYVMFGILSALPVVALYEQERQGAFVQMRAEDPVTYVPPPPQPLAGQAGVD